MLSRGFFFFRKFFFLEVLKPDESFQAHVFTSENLINPQNIHAVVNLKPIVFIKHSTLGKKDTPPKKKKKKNINKRILQKLVEINAIRCRS